MVWGLLALECRFYSGHSFYLKKKKKGFLLLSSLSPQHRDEVAGPTTRHVQARTGLPGMSTQLWTQQHHNKIQNKLFAEKAKTAEKQHKKKDWHSPKSWVKCSCPWVPGGWWQPPMPQLPLTPSQMLCAGMCNIPELPREGTFLYWPMKCVSPSSSMLHCLSWAITTGGTANASLCFEKYLLARKSRGQGPACFSGVAQIMNRSPREGTKPPGILMDALRVWNKKMHLLR